MACSDNCLACNHVLFHVDFEQYLIVIVDGCFQIYLYFEGFRWTLIKCKMHADMNMY